MYTATQPAFRVTRRFYFGVGISIALHVAIMLNIGPADYRYSPTPPLTVDIQQILPEQPILATVVEPLPPSAIEPPPEAKPEPVQTAPAAAEPSPSESTPREPPQVASIVPPREIAGFSAPQDKYFTLAEIDVRPHPINEVDLVYPVRAYALRTRGKVVLTIFISAEGSVDEIRIIKSTPPGVFEEAAVTATLALKFSPGMRYGQRVKSQQTIEVDFDPYETINKP